MNKIGDIELNGKVILGPMAGVTTLAYREFMKPFGVALSYSEMISDCGIDYGNSRTLTYLATSNIDRPVGLQLFGYDKDNLVKAIGYVEEKAEYEILDINLGCPVHKVTKTGAGSAWLKNPPALYEMMRAVVSASHKPVTAKVRLGWDEEHITIFEVVEALEEAGVSMITVHARTTSQLYEGEPNYELIRDLRGKMNIPLCVSGNIFKPEDALKAMEITGADYVMVARGGLGNPRLVTNINLALEGKELLPQPTVLEQCDWAEDFSMRLIEQCGERQALMMLRGLAPHFFKGFPGYKKVRANISMSINTKEDLVKIFAGIRKRNSL